MGMNQADSSIYNPYKLAVYSFHGNNCSLDSSGKVVKKILFFRNVSLESTTYSTFLCKQSTMNLSSPQFNLREESPPNMTKEFRLGNFNFHVWTMSHCEPAML